MPFSIRKRKKTVNHCGSSLGFILLTSEFYGLTLSDTAPSLSLLFSFPARFATLLQTFSHVYPAQGHQSFPQLPRRQHQLDPGQCSGFSLPVHADSASVQSLRVGKLNGSGAHPGVPRREHGFRGGVSSVSHKYVSSFRAGTHRGQYAVPLDLRRQYRGLFRPSAVSAVLPRLWVRRGLAPCSLQSELDGSGAWRQRCDLRGHGSVHAAVSAGTHSDAGLHPGILVSSAVSSGDQRAGGERFGGSGLVGARWRVPAWNAAHTTGEAQVGVPAGLSKELM